jgi:DNA-binding XRE family transcriptional regulator
MSKEKKQPPRRLQEERMRAKGYMTVADVAAVAGVNRQTVNLWLAKGALTSIHVAERIYIEKKSLETYLGPEGVRALAGTS